MKWTVLILLPLLLGACDDMTDQPKTPPQGKGGQESANAPDGMVEASADKPAPALTQSLVQRGRDDYHAFCAPCHAERGDGKGMVVQRGFPEPPSFHTEEARAMAPKELYTVVSDGKGAMYGFAARISPADRWAIVAYVKALQVSHGE